MRFFIEKLQKLPSARGFAPRAPCLRQLGALLTNPKSPEPGGFAHRTPMALVPLDFHTWYWKSRERLNCAIFRSCFFSSSPWKFFCRRPWAYTL